MRKRWLIAGFVAGQLRGAYWGIAGKPSNYPYRPPLDVLRRVRLALHRPHPHRPGRVLRGRARGAGEPRVPDGRDRAPPARRQAAAQRPSARGALPQVDVGDGRRGGAARQLEDEASPAAGSVDSRALRRSRRRLGFRGSVVAYWAAEAGRRVLLLERGKTYLPGSPRSPYGLARNLWDPSEGLHGMFNVWSFRGIDVR